MKDWIVFHGRVERAQTERVTTDILDEVAVTWQYVVGMEFFPLPYLEIRPEYRCLAGAVIVTRKCLPLFL